MEYIRVTRENIEKEHICCAISNNKDKQVSSKKAWLADRFDDVGIKDLKEGGDKIYIIGLEELEVLQNRLQRVVNAEGGMLVNRHKNIANRFVGVIVRKNRKTCVENC